MTANQTPLPDNLPADWRPTPAHLLGTTPAACDRCGRIGRLRLGPGDALCPRCADAEAFDRALAGAHRNGG